MFILFFVMFKKIFLLWFFILFWSVVFADWFWYTDLYFSDWSTTGKSLDMNITVGTWLSGFWVNVYNPYQDSQSIELRFASQVQTSDGLPSCDMISGLDFWDNFLWNTWVFSIAYNQTVQKRIDFDFPVCASGLFLWCVVQLPSTFTSLWSFDVYPGKVNFLTLQVSPSNLCVPFSLKVFPGSRPSANFANLGEIRFYNLSGNLVYSWLVETTESGTWLIEEMIPSWIYNVVYKWQSQLASYLTNISIIQWEEMSLDFTTWTNLSNTQNKSISQDDGYQYQIAGDLKNTLGFYDFMINWNDIAILTVSGFIDQWVSILDPKNLNGDSAINVGDVSIVWINFEQTDPFLNQSLFTW